MLIAEATVETDRPSRYLVQLCQHVNRMGRHLRERPGSHPAGQERPEIQQVEWSDTHGIIRFDWGQCTLRANPDTLTLRAEAADEEKLRRLQDLLARRLEGFGRRDQLKVDWQRPDAPTIRDPSTTPHGPATNTASTPTGKAAARRGRRATIALLAAGGLAVAVHLGLFGAVLASRWAGWAADAVIAVVLLKVIIVAGHLVVGRLVVRRGKAAKAGS